jgi:putative DNA primase/helicase
LSEVDHNSILDLDGVYEVKLPEHLKAWKDPDRDAVLTGCKHISEFGVCTETFESINYRQSVYSILFPLLGASAHDWIHNKLKVSSKYDEGSTENELIMSARVSPGPYTCEEMLKHSDIDCPECQSGEYTSPINIKPKDYIETEETGFWSVVYNKSGNIKSQTPCFPDVYKKWCQTYEHVTLSDTALTYVFNGSFWEMKSAHEIRGFMQTLMTPKPKDGHRKEFLAQVKCEKLRPEDWFQSSTDGFINLKNGVFNIDKSTMEPHSSEFGFRYELPYGYDESAKCPRFKKFLEEITLGRKDMERVLIEFMGYSLANGLCLAEKALILYGSGSNGKSTFMDVLKALAGSDNYSSLSLTALNRDTKRYMIDGKLFNIGEETNVKALSDSEVFKTMVTGGEIDVKKLFVQDYVIKNRCKLIMACNELPKSSDRSDGLYRRMLLVPFNAKFTEAKKDANIREKLFEELPGIFNLAIQGYRDLKRNQWKFSRSKNLEIALDEYKIENDNILLWNKENLEWTGDEGDIVFKHELHESYKRMCDEDGYFPVNKISFFKSIKNSYPDWKEGKRYHPIKGRVRVIYGLKLEGGTIT